MNLSKRPASDPARLPATSEDRLAQVIDLTNDSVDVENVEFHLNDRVERLLGYSEQTHWGTITDEARDDERHRWLVLDNNGDTHWDKVGDLAPTVPASKRRDGLSGAGRQRGLS